MGDRGFDLFTLFVSLQKLSPSGLLAEMAGHLNWLEWQAKKLFQKRPVPGSKGLKYTKKLKGAWLFFLIGPKIKLEWVLKGSWRRLVIKR